MIKYTRRDLFAASAGTLGFLTLGSITGAGARGNTVGQLPKAFRPNDVILMQGDSITDGGRQRENADPNHDMGQDYCLLVAGALNSTYTNANLAVLNRGEGGNDVPALAARWQTDTLDPKPNMVSVLVGVNDANYALNKNISPDTAGATYQAGFDALLQQTVAALPDVRLVLGQPFVLKTGRVAADYDTWNAQIAEMRKASESLASKYNAAYVRYGEMMDRASVTASHDHWSWDGIHPTYAGVYLMHSLWIETVTKFFG